MMTPVGCDRSGATGAARPASQPAATQAPAASQPAAEAVGVKLAALRDLVGRQDRAADRATYAAYLVKDDDPAEAPAVARALSQAMAGSAGPPVVGAIDVYVRKGRPMDRASGRPVKVFHARVVSVDPAGGRAEAVATCKAGRLEGDTSYRYLLLKDGSVWHVADATAERTADVR